MVIVMSSTDKKYNWMSWRFQRKLFQFVIKAVYSFNAKKITATYKKFPKKTK